MRMSCIAVSLLCLATGGHASKDAPFAFPRSTPEAQGVSSAALLRFVDEAEQKVDALHSVMVVRHGQVVAEGWWKPYAADEPHMLFSLSKSFTATAVGLAIAEGNLSAGRSRLAILPRRSARRTEQLVEGDARSGPADDVDRPSRGGHPRLPVCLERQPREAIHGSDRFAQARNVFRLQHAGELHALGNRAEGHGPDGARLSETEDFRAARHREPHLGFEQAGDLDGRLRAQRAHGGHRAIRAAVPAEGRWQGQQLVPASWVDAATARQMSNGSSPTSDWEQGYGYQFWRCRHGFYRGDGAHGQFCIVMPQYDAVVAITSGTRDMASVMNVVWDRLDPCARRQGRCPPTRRRTRS